jgi:N-acyl-D-aspartate/D-glutamate deacylase
MFRFGNPPIYAPKKEDSFAAIAAREGRTPEEVTYDALLESDGTDFIYTTISSYAYGDLSMAETLLHNPNCIMGLGDGGAHVAFILDAGFQTWMLTHWGRTLNKFTPEELIRRLTSDTAGAAGLYDRGILRPGMKADVNVIDWDRLGAGKPYIAHDLPAGGKRLLQEVYGYEATIVSGQITYREGHATGALPGKLVRGPQAA